MTSRRSDRAATKSDRKEARLDHPSGVLYLFQHRSVPLILDTLLSLPPGREFNKTELAEMAGVTRQTVGRYVDLLLEVTILEAVDETSPQRYRVADSPVVEELHAVNSAINATAHTTAGSGSDPSSNPNH